MLNIQRHNYRQSTQSRQILNNINGELPSISYNMNHLEPVIIRGDGNITIFGLNNHFSTEMPPKLISFVAPDEFRNTIYVVNRVLKKKLSFNSKLLFCGCLCCCCTLGLSACPTLAFNKKTKNIIMDILEKENKRLYHPLGLHWSLTKQTFGTLPMIEYVLQIEFITKPKLSIPD